MTGLVSGANQDLPPGVLSVLLAGPCDLSVLILGEDGRVSGDPDMVFYNQPAAPGVRLRAERGGHGVELEPARLRHGACRAILIASPADGETPFGRLPPPVLTVRAGDGSVVATLRPPRLGPETAVQLAEVYRRGARWKIRALGQGYADGLAGLARDFGVEVDDSATTGGRAAAQDGAAEGGAAAGRRVPAGGSASAGGRFPAGRAGSGASVPVPAQPPGSAPVRARGSVPPPRIGTSRRDPGALPTDPVLAEVVALTNAERARAGLPGLVPEPRLASAAARHSADMVTRGFFAHETPDGVSVADRVRAAGYAYAVVAENIAAGQRTAAEVVAGWMDSPGHRANILRPEVRQIGVGRVEGGEYGVYWTQVFGTERGGG